MHMTAVEATHEQVQVHEEHEQLEHHAVHIQQEEDVLEESKQEHEEEGEDSMMYENDPGSGDETAIDTTEDFLKIFQGKTEFDSWEEFSNLFEDFQRVTGSAYKPRSATSIEYANERRNKDKIDDRFVYQTVKMVCQNFGVPVKKENTLRKTKKYVGLGCEAMVHLRYKQGSLNIVSCNLEHKNHSLHCGHEIVSVRSFSFTDEVDFMIAKVSLEHNPFTAPDQDRQWNVIVRDLQQRDVNLKTVNMRMVKKRVRFLIDRYMSNINGKTPLPDDEMGIILYELAQTRQDAVDNPPRGRGRLPKRKRGRPRKYRQESDSDLDQDITNDFMDDDMDGSDDEIVIIEEEDNSSSKHKRLSYDLIGQNENDVTSRMLKDSQAIFSVDSNSSKESVDEDLQQTIKLLSSEALHPPTQTATFQSNTGFTVARFSGKTTISRVEGSSFLSTDMDRPSSSSASRVVSNSSDQPSTSTSLTNEEKNLLMSSSSENYHFGLYVGTVLDSMSSEKSASIRQQIDQLLFGAQSVE